MADSEVKSAALWLGKLLAEEIVYLGSVTGKVETLQTELNTLAAFIQEAVKSRSQDARVQTTLSQARSLAYDCEDVIETYILKVARHGYEQYEGGCQLGSALRWACIFREALPVHEIRSQIDDINARISILKTNLVSYGVTAMINQDDGAGPSESSPSRRVYAHERDERVVVGLERDVEVLVGSLMDPDDKKVINICGMGGLGKSTLVVEVYHHPSIREGGYFQAFGWAHASQRFNPNRVIRSILYSLVDEDDHDGRAKIDEDIRADRAHEALYERMNRVKCLVVVDDIWTPGDWAQIEAAFPRRTANGSRIMLTTRNKDILSSSSNLDQDQVHIHFMEGLDYDNSWKLFRMTAFSGGICTDPAKEELGKKIMQHCKGNPLAIVVVGKSLKMNERTKDWERMHNNISSEIKRGGAPLEAYTEVFDVLQVSYDELPHNLKKCFLQLANYPGDRLFDADKMYAVWSGEGIAITECPNNRSEDEQDIYERYLEDLVSRNMVQVHERTNTGSILTFNMHDLMRNLSLDIAKREGSYQNVSCQSVGSFKDNLPPVRDKGLRSLAVYISIEHQDSTLPSNSSIKVLSRAPNLRSLFIFSINEEGEVDCTSLVETTCNDYPLLRVFFCEAFHITGKLPKKLGNLIHLKFLSLRGTRITKLPSSIQKLQSLQTLNLEVDNVVENLFIPNVLWKMKQLTHIYFPSAQALHKMIEREGLDLQRYSVKGGGVLKLNGLCNLHTLYFIDLDRTDLKDSSTLERLKCMVGTCKTNKVFLHLLLQLPSTKKISLRVHAEIINEDPLALSRCQVLKGLDLYVEPYSKIHLRQPLKLPNSIIHITIWSVQLDEDPLPVLEKLPHLARLSLCMCYNGHKMVSSSLGFPQLNRLYMQGLPRFTIWEVEQGALQKLKHLTIYDCGLTEVPDALANTPYVQFRHITTSTQPSDD